VGLSQVGWPTPGVECGDGPLGPASSSSSVCPSQCIVDGISHGCCDGDLALGSMLAKSCHLLMGQRHLRTDHAL
jgi:hypothetical protein